MSSVRIDQMLYGYRKGHTLLASSLKNRLKNQGLIDVLSDASGGGEFFSYVAGYPILEDGYYVLSKTWYADEMPRPGCVWTHILLIPIDCLGIIHNGRDILELFRRPTDSDDYSSYDVKIELNDGYAEDSRQWNIACYSYVVYTLFSSDSCVYVCDEGGDKYEAALADMLLKLPIEYAGETSFCTWTKVNRYVNDIVFSYQISDEKSIRHMSKGNDEAVIYKGITEDAEFPIWTKYLTDLFVKDQHHMLFELAKFYEISNRRGIRELSKLLYAVDGFRSKQVFADYVSLLDKLEDGDRLRKITVSDAICSQKSFLIEMFTEDSVLGFLLGFIQRQDSYPENRNERGDNEEISDYRARRFALQIYENKDRKKIKNIFHSYLNRDLDSNGLKIVTYMLDYIKPVDLKGLFEMEKSVCTVLVRKKPELAECEDIWRQNRNYQLEILNTVSRERIGQDMSERISRAVVRTSKKNVAVFAYKALGESIQEEVFTCVNAFISGKRVNAGDIDSFLKEWLPVMVSNRALYLKTINLPLDWVVVRALMEIVDSYKITEEDEHSAWKKLINMFEDAIIDEDIYKQALFSLPIVLKELGGFSEKMKNWVFDRINEKLECDEMDYEDWMRMESLLSPIEEERAWDKCLRLRMSFGRV